MSYVKRAGHFAGRVAQAQKNVELAVQAANKQAALIIQAEVVQRVPVKTGKLRDMFASSEAIQESWKYPGGYVFGLATGRLKSDGFYAQFVEYGTKGYSKGEFRYAGTRPNGKVKLKKVKKGVPARPAHPFFRPGVAAGRARIKALYAGPVKQALKDAT